MKTSLAGRKAITVSEDNRLKAYKDGGGVWTIGIGHTAAAGPPTPKAGMTITASESEAIFERDLVPYETTVNVSVKVPISQNQFDALVSLCFNIGQGAFKKSSLVRKLNKGDYGGAADSFLQWNKDNGKTIPGLTKRRQRERKLFLTGGVPLISPKPTAPIVPISDKEVIKRVQIGLALLNYNPGGADGIIGPLTAGAIRVFRSDAGLPEGDFIDDALIKALANAKPREMVAARKNATPAQVATAVPEAKAHWWNKWIAGGGAGSATVLAVGDAITPAKGYVDQLREDVPGWAWFALLAVFCSAIAYMALRGGKASDEAYRTGDRR